MSEELERRIEEEILDEEKRLNHIEIVVDQVKAKVLEKRPSHFSNRDVINALFGASTIGLTFMFKGLLIEVGVNLSWENIMIIITSTLVFLTMEIYFIGYSRVINKVDRKFGQFYLKRLVTVYGIALSVSFYFLYIFGFMFLPEVDTFSNFMKLVFVLSMPCSIGAAIPNLLKKY